MSDDLKKSAEELVEETLSNIGAEDTKEEVVKSTEVAPEEKKEEAAPEVKTEEVKKSEEVASTVIRKSLAELAEVLTEDELNVIEAWRAEMDSDEVNVEETVQKSITADDLSKSVADAVNAQMADLRKAIDGKDELIKSLSDKVEQLSAQPAERRSVDNLAVIEKSQETQALTKAQVINKMLDLQKSEAGVTSRHVAEFEATNNISDQKIRDLVMNAFAKS